LFPFVVDDIHIISLTSFVHHAIDHFAQLDSWGLIF
jgi:hypothetical protein